mgnify:CR=1 FL=1
MNDEAKSQSFFNQGKPSFLVEEALVEKESQSFFNQGKHILKCEVFIDLNGRNPFLIKANWKLYNKRKPALSVAILF